MSIDRMMLMYVRQWDSKKRRKFIFWQQNDERSIQKKSVKLFVIICLFHQYMFAATDLRTSQVRLMEWKRLRIQYYTFNCVFLILFEFSEYGF